MRLSGLVWRSASVFLLAGLLETLLHELGHAVTAIALGGHPVVLFPGKVLPGGLPDSKGVVVAAAGPLFSLLLAALGWLACRGLRERPQALLAAVWFTFHAFIGAVGYLVLTPFADNDLGGIARYFGFPPFVRYGMMALGIYGMTRISGVLLPILARFAPSSEALASPQTRARFVLLVAIVPWLVTVVAHLLYDLPIQHLASVAPTLCTGIPLLSAYFDVKKRDDLAAGNCSWPEGMPWAWLLGCLAMLALNRLVLHEGFPLTSRP